MTYVTFPGVAYRDITLPVPLDWAKPEGESLTLFAREVVDPARKEEDLPLLVFLQGGPGGKGPRPQGGGPAWLKNRTQDIPRRAARSARHGAILTGGRGAICSALPPAKKVPVFLPASGQTASFAIASICAKRSIVAANGRALARAMAVF